MAGVMCVCVCVCVKVKLMRRNTSFDDDHRCGYVQCVFMLNVEEPLRTWPVYCRFGFASRGCDGRARGGAVAGARPTLKQATYNVVPDEQMIP